jgi:hypothetical protein
MSTESAIVVDNALSVAVAFAAAAAADCVWMDMTAMKSIDANSRQGLNLRLRSRRNLFTSFKTDLQM